MIAGLYINRIHAACRYKPTLPSSLPCETSACARIANAHLTIDSPYNTYRNLGLPPGPIRIPTPIGIDAV